MECNFKSLSLVSETAACRYVGVSLRDCVLLMWESVCGRMQMCRHPAGVCTTECLCVSNDVRIKVAALTLCGVTHQKRHIDVLPVFRL